MRRSRDLLSGVPICSHAYAGNRPDVTQFATVIGELAARFGALAGTGDGLTVVYDARMDSADNQRVIEAAGLHFVGSLVPSNHPDLLAVPARRYAVVDEERFPGVTAFEAQTNALGAERRVVVTHSQTFHDAQTRGFAQTLAKASHALAELAERLARPEENLAAGATVLDASSSFSDSFAPELAVDGDLGTEWSTRGDGDGAFLVIDVGEPVEVGAVELVTRSMGDGSAVTETYTVSVDGGDPVGPFPAATPAKRRPSDVTLRGPVFRFEVASSTGGNVGAVEVARYRASG